MAKDIHAKIVGHTEYVTLQGSDSPFGNPGEGVDMRAFDSRQVPCEYFEKDR